MIKDFVFRKENIFIIIIAILSLMCIVLGFSFLFLKNDSLNSQRIIPNSITEITWKNFNSKILENKIVYPEYMLINEQRELSGVGLNIVEFDSKNFLTYFSNQNHVSIYPEGIDNQLFYGKSREGEYTSSTGQIFLKKEYLTSSNEVWGVALIPKEIPKGWSSNGFIWIQTTIKNKKDMCISRNGILINNVICDPYSDQLPIYSGDIQGQFIRVGYEIINKNLF